MKNPFILRFLLFVTLLLLFAACTIQLAKPTAPRKGPAKKGGTKSLAEPCRLLSFPEETQSAYTVRDDSISFVSDPPVVSIFSSSHLKQKS